MEISIDPVSILSLSVCSLENSQNSTVPSTAFSFSLSLLSVIFSSYQFAETTFLRAQFTNDLLINKFNGLLQVLT